MPEHDDGGWAAARPVLSFGETLIDLIVSDGSHRLRDAESFAVRPGGAPANVAVALARLGVPSAFCGVIGNDPFGDRLRRTLAVAGVDVSRLRRTDDADTTIAFAWKDERGDGHFRLLRMADRLLDIPDVEAAGIERAAAIIVGSVALSAEPSRRAVSRAVEIAADRGIPVCFDVNMRPTLWPDADAARAACAPILERATLLKLSLDDGKFLYDEAIDAEQALRRGVATGARFVVVTDGARGAWFATSAGDPVGKENFVPAFGVDAIEPTGAGDAFHAAIVCRLIEHQWFEITKGDVEYAAAAGALATTKRGAMEALPTHAEIVRFLAERRGRPNGPMS